MRELTEMEAINDAIITNVTSELGQADHFPEVVWLSPH